MNFKSEESHQRVLDAQKRGWETVRKNSKLKEEEYYKNPKPCKQCSRPILYDRQKNDFCSRSCSAKYNNIKRSKNIDEVSGRYIGGKSKERDFDYIKKEYFCVFCGNKLNKNNFKYCSSKCQSLFRQMEISKKIESGENVTNSALRKYLMLKHDSKCQKCGWGMKNPTSGTVCLDMHHVDGDANNNVLSNVEILCPNCHSLTNTYKRVDKDRKSSRINRKW